ncbi:uncharacterized protein J3R85_020785 [Psidium guajava]|nr:uncharacterized protein J3R85_020785 [Psidium guajava]
MFVKEKKLPVGDQATMCNPSAGTCDQATAVMATGVTTATFKGGPSCVQLSDDVQSSGSGDGNGRDQATAAGRLCFKAAVKTRTKVAAVMVTFEAL